ncbi:Peptidyl-prolyl cis-trans isomerase ESS1 [Durusdinium trenchii]|uniref:Peptidyl-prolyl cis-trans isomerase ESS1 n=1 Tax=Durusdinium trenchii TaxID=1381693 RepID=A0ABP0M1M0_9DINO
MSKPTAPKPTAPAGGSAWRYYASTEVLGAEGAAGLVGIFAPSSKPGEVIDPELLEAESKEAKARKFGGGGLSWDVPGVPPPDFFIESDEPGTLCRAQLSVFSKGIKEFEYLKEARIYAPWRSSLAEARKDGCELRRTAFRSARQDPLLGEVRRKCFELENKQWNLSELASDRDCEAVVHS